MTQIKQGLFKSPALTYVVTSVEDNGLSKDKSPSPELFEMIQAAASSLTGFAQLWESIRKKGTTEGFSDAELQDMLRPLLRDRLGMSKDKIYYLFHQEEKKEQSKQSYHRNIPPVLPKKELEQNNNPPIEPHKPEVEIKEQSDDDRVSYWTGQQKENIANIRGLEAEIDYINSEMAKLRETLTNANVDIQSKDKKINDLEDALKKTEQFRPATQLQQPPIANADEHYFKWLADRDNGVTCYYYDGYGVELFKSRVLTQLKAKGVMTFKRLYFEV